MTSNYPRQKLFQSVGSFVMAGMAPWILNACGGFHPNGNFQEHPLNPINVSVQYVNQAVEAGTTPLVGSETLPYVATVAGYDGNVIGSFSITGGEFDGVTVLNAPVNGSVFLPDTDMVVPGYEGCDIQLEETLGLGFADSNDLTVTVTKTYTMITTLSAAFGTTCPDLFDSLRNALLTSTPLNPPFDIPEAAGVLNNLAAGYDIYSMQVVTVAAGSKY